VKKEVGIAARKQATVLPKVRWGREKRVSKGGRGGERRLNVSSKRPFCWKKKERGNAEERSGVD